MYDKLEEAFGIPAGTTNVTSIKERVRTIETAMTARTTEIELKTKEVMSIKDDTALDIEEKLSRSKEYLRMQAVTMYESVSDMLVIMKAELMPGAQPAMWTAYSNLMRTALECHKRIGDVYRQLEEDAGLHLPAPSAEATSPDATQSQSMSVTRLMELLEQASESATPLDPNKAIEIAAEEIQ